MLLRKIIMENFRQFNGVHEINFSTDKEKNVTLILGDNGSGKTTIAQAFHWCFYGETPKFLKKDSLLSSKIESSMYDGWTRNLRVCIEMSHDEKSYTITRKKCYRCNEGKIIADNPSLKIILTDCETGETKSLTGKELENAIEEILPKDLAEYFFLSAEKVTSMSTDIRGGKSKDFAKAVNTLLDLDYFKSAIKHLNAIIKEYDTSKFEGMTDQVENLSRDIEIVSKNIETISGKIKNFEDTKNYFDDKISDIKAELKTKESSRDMEIERQSYETKLAKSKDCIDIETKSGLREFIKKAPSFFAHDAMKTALATLEQTANIKTEEIPERLHADLIDWIEKNHRCICGSEIVEDSALFEKLESWRNIVPPESIGTILKQERQRIIDKSKIGSDLYESIKSTYEEIQKETDYIDEYNEKIDELTKKIANSQDTSTLQKNLTHYQEQRDEAEKQYQDCLWNLNQSKSKYSEKIKERDKILSTNKEGKRIIKWKNETTNLIEGFKRLLEKEEKEKREMLIEAVKEAFVKIYGTTFSITVDENYHISTDSRLEKSDGQGMAIIYSFLAGLLSVIKTERAKKRENESSADESLVLESYPLVLDAAFNALDKTRISSLCKVLPKVSEQIIVFLFDIYGEQAKKEMGEKIGKCYNLVKLGENDDEVKIEEVK